MRDTIARKTNSSQYSCNSETPSELCHMVYVSALSQTYMCSVVFLLLFFLSLLSSHTVFSVRASHLGFPTCTSLVGFFSLTFMTFSRTWGWRRQWHPTPVLLPGKSHGRRSLVGCSPWDCEESDTTERLLFHFSLSCIGEGNGNPLQCSRLENPRDREPGGLPSLGSHRVGHDWSNLAATVGHEDRIWYKESRVLRTFQISE